MKKKTLMLLSLLVMASAQAQPDLTRLRPRVEPVPAEQIARVNARSGLTDCFWAATVSPDTLNILIPDSGVVYWLAQFQLPAGAALRFEGRYPHARHISFNSYDAAGMPVDRVNDLMLPAAPGATNPFLPGARRDGAQRGYTLRVAEREGLRAGQPLDETLREPGTLYVPRAEAGAGRHQLWYRIYVPDAGRDRKGGVPLPEPVLTTAAGHELRGEALCRTINVAESVANDVRVPAEALQPLLKMRGEQIRSPHHPAQNPPSWNAFFNAPLSALNLLIGTPQEALRQRMDVTRRGGFYSTLDNTYMSSYVDRRHGELLVLQGRAPRTPRTGQGQATMAADAELRYWSLCKNRSLADTAVDACLYDEQVPVDRAQRYTIVVSTVADRPANARAECGVAWLDWGTAGDGIGNPDGGFLVFRHMLPHPDFKQSLFATRKLGDEREVLGPFHPESAYMSRAAFEQRGCAGKG